MYRLLYASYLSMKVLKRKKVHSIYTVIFKKRCPTAFVNGLAKISVAMI